MTSLTGTLSEVLGTIQRATIFEQDNRDNVVEFDASVSEQHDGSSTVTDHPVEDGVDITDHVRKEPDGLTMNVIVSNHQPIMVRSINAEPASPGGDPGSRAEDAYRYLKDVKDKGLVVRASTTLRDYKDMIITSLGVSRDAPTGNMVNMTITLREIQIATTETTDVPEPTNPSRKKRQQLGRRQKPDASAATSQRTQSLLTQIFSAFGG
jgi:hypothetical protein